MAEFNSSDPAVIQAAVPASATLQITLGNGDTDTITLNPMKAAALVKTLRQGGNSDFPLHGILLNDSIEAKAHNRHITLNGSGITEHQWKGWLFDKAAQA